MILATGSRGLERLIGLRCEMLGGMALNRWIELTERNPGHFSWYVERFRSMVAAGDDLGGEARFIATPCWVGGLVCSTPGVGRVG